MKHAGEPQISQIGADSDAGERPRPCGRSYLTVEEARGALAVCFGVPVWSEGEVRGLALRLADPGQREIFLALVRDARPARENAFPPNGQKKTNTQQP
jgi:hypothetical protein